MELSGLEPLTELKADGAQPHLVEALERAATEMGDTYRQLMQGTYYAVLDPSGCPAPGASVA